MTVTKKNKYYPSSSGFYIPAGTMSKYNAGCLRFMLVSSKQRGPALDPLFMKIGTYHEKWYEGFLGDRVAGIEVVSKSDITPLTELSGRIDFIDTLGVIHETKASFSNNIWTNVIRDGKYELGHLSQIVCYMIDREVEHGVIAVGYYEINELGEYVQSGFRQLHVSIDADGAILVDGVLTGYDVFQQLEHRRKAAEVLELGTMAGRPANYGQHTSPCYFCPLASTCDRYDAGEIDKEEFVRQGMSDLKNSTGAVAKPRGITKRRVKK